MIFARNILRAVALVCAACCLLPAPNARAGVMTVHDVVNVRAGRGTHSAKVARLVPGDAVLAAEAPDGDGWQAVADLSGRALGHVYAPLLHPFGNGAPGRPATVDAVVNVRAGRGTHNAKVARLVPGDAVLASDEVQGWCAVADASGEPLGYVHAPLLRRVAALDADPGPATVHDMLPDLGGWKLTLTPSVSQAVAYDDNVFFKDVADIESRTSPGLAIRAEDDRTSVEAVARLDIFRYKDLDEFDRENMSTGLSLTHALSPRLELFLDGAVSRDHTFLDTLEETGDIVDKTPRWTRKGKVGGALLPDERTVVRAWADAHDATHAVSQRRDNHGHALGVDLAREMAGQRFSLLMEAQAARYAYMLGDQRVRSLLAGGRWRPGPTITARALAGFEHTLTDMPGADSQTDVHPALDASVQWKKERAGLTVGAQQRQVKGTSGENIERSLVWTTASWDVTERLQGLMSARLLYSGSEGYASPSKSRSIFLRPSLRYTLEDGYLELLYSHQATQNRYTSRHQHANRLEFQFVFEFPEVF